MVEWSEANNACSGSLNVTALPFVDDFASGRHDELVGDHRLKDGSAAAPGAAALFLVAA